MKHKLEEFFDWVVVINLDRRTDRLRRFEQALSEIEWPFKSPEVFKATDGLVDASPSDFISGPGAWGCLQSHSRVIEETIRRGFNSVLVLEDDVCFVQDFSERVADFLARVPDDWDQLMLGGQHNLEFFGAPVEEASGILRCRDCERTHCYALQGQFKTTLLERWRGGGKFDGKVHCDWIMARDPHMQLSHKVYAPSRFLAGQELNHSDIVKSVVPRYFWNPPDPELPVLLLRCPADVLDALRPHGIHTGLSRNPHTAVDQELTHIFYNRSRGRDAHILRLQKWLELRLWEVSADPHLVCTVWHPQATVEELQLATTHPVRLLEADSLDEALRAMPEDLRRETRPLRVTNVVIHLTTMNKEVIRQARSHGWHNGFNIDPESQLNLQLDTLCRSKTERWRRIGALRRIVSSLVNEASTIAGGVPVVWHPEIDRDLTQEVTALNVVEIAADDLREALAKWNRIGAGEARLDAELIA